MRRCLFNIDLLTRVYELEGFTAQKAAPAPSTWAIMLIGFGGLGFAAYRRSRLAISIV